MSGRVANTCDASIDLDIVARDGYLLGATLYGDPAAYRGRVAVMLCAMGVRQERYAMLARFLADRGWNVVTFDYRGIGRSAVCKPEDCSATLFDWAEKDVAGVLDWVRNRFCPRKFVAIGHSIGGQILPLAANHPLLDKAVLIASQKGYTQYWDMPWRTVVWLYWRTLPLLVWLFKRLPSSAMGCEDLPPHVAIDWQRWALHPDFVDENWHSLAPAFEAFTAPILSISFSDDHLYAPPRAVRALLQLYPNAPNEQWQITPPELGLDTLGHSRFFRHEAFRGLWERMAEWAES